MSFKVKTDEEFNTDWFNLLAYPDDMPRTGIKISLDGIKYFEYAGNAKSNGTFRFTDSTASKDADLSDLKVLKQETNEDDPDNPVIIDEEILLTPQFDKDTLDYEITLLEYLDKVKILATQSDEKATMKIKVPKRNENRRVRI